MFELAETMVNLKSWVLVIFELNSPISCQSIKQKQKPGVLPSFGTDVSFVSRVNMQGNFITLPAEFDVTFDFALYSLLVQPNVQ